MKARTFIADGISGANTTKSLIIQHFPSKAVVIDFAGRLSRRFQNLDYYVSMGGTAYSVLQQNAVQRARQDQARVFGELATGFRHFVLVAEVTGRVPADPEA